MTRAKKTPCREQESLPLALRVIAMRCTPGLDGHNHHLFDSMLADAYGVARKLLAESHEIMTDVFRDGSEHVKQHPKYREIVATCDAEDFLGELQFEAKERAFMIGLAVAFEIHQAFASGGAR